MRLCESNSESERKELREDKLKVTLQHADGSSYEKEFDYLPVEDFFLRNVLVHQ